MSENTKSHLIVGWLVIRLAILAALCANVSNAVTISFHEVMLRIVLLFVIFLLLFIAPPFAAQWYIANHLK